MQPRIEPVIEPAMESVYRVNAPAVVSETVDGEVVMIHLDSGNYYSLRGTGAAIWAGIQHGIAVGDIATAIASNGNGDSEAAAVASFIGELLAEQLIVASEGAPPAGWRVPPPPEPLEPPVLEKFTDMQHLILLDPVHEVDRDAGWPRPRDDA